MGRRSRKRRRKKGRKGRNGRNHPIDVDNPQTDQAEASPEEVAATIAEMEADGLVVHGRAVHEAGCRCTICSVMQTLDDAEKKAKGGGKWKDASKKSKAWRKKQKERLKDSGYILGLRD